MIVYCEAYRARRFAGLNVATIGGSSGCVVTANKLYVNGIYARDLTAGEQAELTKYAEEVKKYKSLKVVAQRRGDALSQTSAIHMFRDSSRIKLPDPPKKPSFCAAVDTTQYYFDGCMVQNNKVFVGREYARDLTDDEIKQLKEFDAKMKVYQQYLSDQRIKNVGWLQGDSLVKLLLGQDVSGAKDQVATTEVPTTRSSGATEPPEVPETPNFCTAIL
ncbi:unnamed protein product [Enterobius vermicularis]|uniref:Pepsin-I3 domain-containing protein n=1 Tax=Enterobius vermicularis TaxID=51028 RepID=A0A0N4VL80_ENTVE|nr:unnamed protein product [Enterobius vermicularis]